MGGEVTIAQDYSDLGLNTNLQNINSPITKNNYTTYAEFDANTEGVNASKVSAGAFTGSITVGSNQQIELNGANSQLIVRNGTNGTVAIIDKSGISVYGQSFNVFNVGRNFSQRIFCLWCWWWR